ncbi:MULTISPECIES: A/G-specific adenine glycosylase [unclassified Sphingomonas]|uniref:A/G-specific adenine glycosylase n=1 Tax=unclassified Sphingomonas TaxID=196159 RepID=UPI0006F580ED|nr:MULTISPECIES: A/G-specific adenine glycosylase [unclassified Sphingomonas]KQX19293.1 A/G-specific adenine glycosylase [Sphingomonas sp. Root1294]KQY65497.1 A/G-specific adenine glycosylase [Sphingomonas sp. Root50]KRB95204.1 A/G-specific adenine glycosylase [Sphingomonas sp. Root720]
MSVDAVPENLLAWYDAHHRRLPWRAGPGGVPTDPYRVWLSEIMLQQTTVAAVKPYFERFTARWPTVADLAAADDADVMSAWAGLGYYARARNLVACARAVADDHGGAFPDSEAGLRTLPGIGDYSAAAIAAIAFGRRAVVVDANVERVASRLFAFDRELPKARPALRALVDRITPDRRAGDFAQAMMDLGSSICTVRAPQCLLCPLTDGCDARIAGNPEDYPVKAAKKAKPQRLGTAFWIEDDDRVWLVRRPGKGLLGGMRALPSGPWSDDDPGLAGAPLDASWRDAGSVDHVFTHFALKLRVMATAHPTHAGDGEWWPIDGIADAGLPTLFARAAARAIASRDA